MIGFKSPISCDFLANVFPVKNITEDELRVACRHLSDKTEIFISRGE